MPCVGIDGCGTALKQLGVPFQGCHVFDLDTRYLEYLQQHQRHELAGGAR